MKNNYLFPEKGVVDMEDILTDKNQFKVKKILENLCLLCKSEKCKIICSTNNVGYRWTCVNCEKAKKVKAYAVETSRSGRLRGKE